MKRNQKAKENDRIKSIEAYSALIGKLGKDFANKNRLWKDERLKDAVKELLKLLKN